MSLIWNNKEYKLVSEDNEWDRLEYVVARKLHIQYVSSQTISIDMIKKSFSIYGAIEKIEIFRDNKTKHQFAHVTFKESRASYLALIDCKQNLETIRPAHAYQQPDNAVDLTKSSFYNLPDKCLVDIFQKLDIPTLANLSVVCKKLCKLLRDHIFVKMRTFDTETSDEADVINVLTTVNRILQCLEPDEFHLKIYRNVKNSHKWPTVFVDFNYAEISRLSIDMGFLKRKWLCKLEPITSLMKSMHVRYTIYDDSLPYKPRNEIMWPNVSALIFSGFSKKKCLPDFSSIVTVLPKLEDLFIQNMFFDFHMKDYCQGMNLRKIVFENCLFKSEMAEKQIWRVVAVLKEKKKDFPLCVKFDRIQFLKTESFEECFNDYNGYGGFNEMYYMNSVSNARFFQRHEQRKRKFVSCDESSYTIVKKIVNDEVAQKYVRIEIGDDPFDQIVSGSATARKRTIDDYDN